MSVPKIKRFIERFNADTSFRNEFLKNSENGMKILGLDLDPEIVRPVWDRTVQSENTEYKRQHGRFPVGSALMEEYRNFYRSKLELNAQVQSESSPRHPQLKVWRDRQVARLSHQVMDANAQIVVHSPVAFELTAGCSVGCYFCSLNAPKLSRVWEYDASNQALWRDVLGVVSEVLGVAAGWGFCYWATDPLDNPDYEKFGVDFAEILGRFPQTTTAKPLDDIERTRKLLKLSASYTPRIINRFSILTTRGLRELHSAFSPDELLRVELVTLNPDGDTVKTKSGRFWKLCNDKPEVWAKETSKLRRMTANQLTDSEWDLLYESLNERTCACVSGFLFNMVERTVKLISPCVPNETFPNGYITFSEAEFTDAEDLRERLMIMIQEGTKTDLDAAQTLRFHPDLQFEKAPSGFALISKVTRLNFENPAQVDYVRYLGEKVMSGDQTAASIALTAQYKFGIHPAVTHSTLNSFFKRGVLQEIESESPSRA